MLGSRTGGVKAKYALVALACLVVGTGCWSRHYPDRLRTHTELLVSFAHKGRDLVTTGRFTAESLPELTYPLERAAVFAEEARRRIVPPPASLAAFDELVVRYRTFVQVVDDVRRDPNERQVAERLDDAVAGVDATAGEVRNALERES